MAETFEHLTWPFFEDHHRASHRELESWIPEGLPKIDDDADERHTCRALVRALGDGGWLRHAVEAVDVRTLCLMRERLASEHGLADFAFAMQGLGSAPIRLFGEGALKERYLPPTTTGTKIAAFALSEPEAGSDVGAITTRARIQGEEIILDGTKTWISNGGIADYYVVFARTEDAPGTKGLSAIVVDADAPGLNIPDTIDVIAPHPLATLAFEGCHVPATNLIGERGQGFKIAMATLDIFRASVGAAALGLSRRALDETLTRVDTRRQFGKKLSEFQLTQARIAEMATAVDASALLVYRSAWAKDAGASRVTKESSMAKMYATESAQDVVDAAVQLAGASGLVRNSVVERLYREVRALRIYEGTTEIQKLIIARQVLPT